LKRLIKEGFTSEEAVELIGTVVVHEIYNVLKGNEDFDRNRFVAALRQLPELPYDEDADGTHQYFIPLTLSGGELRRAGS